MTAVPENDLEKNIVAAQEGSLSPEQFINELYETEVFMPVLEKDDVVDIKSLKKSTLLTMTDAEGKPVVVLFSSSDRAKSFTEQYNDYDGGILSEFKWFVDIIDKDMRIIINPDCEIGFELEADMLNQMSEEHIH